MCLSFLSSVHLILRLFLLIFLPAVEEASATADGIRKLFCRRKYKNVCNTGYPHGSECPEFLPEHLGIIITSESQGAAGKFVKVGQDLPGPAQD